MLIEIAFAGICHSDIHTARGEWGGTLYPLVPGHEIAGTVAAVGSEVRRFEVGDRAGVGCFVDSCRQCDHCLAGEEQYCLKGATWIYNALGPAGRATAGGYSERIVVDERYVLHVPESIPLEAAAPLLCAGITMYSPLRRFGAAPGTRVGIIGLGGLGHLGVRLASAMGAEVTVISQTLRKQEDGYRLGAHRYLAASDPASFEAGARSLDLVVSTLSTSVDVARYLGLLRLDGALVYVGLPEQPLSVPAFALGGRRARLAGSMIGGIRETQEMLDFCAQHGISAEVEVISADEIDKAYDRVVASDVRYRFVVDLATLRG